MQTIHCIFSLMFYLINISLIHYDTIYLSPQGGNDRLKKIVGERAGYVHTLQLNRYGIRLGRTDPDGQIAFCCGLFQDNHSLVIHHTYPDAINAHLDHAGCLQQWSLRYKPSIRRQGCQTRTQVTQELLEDSSISGLKRCHVSSDVITYGTFRRLLKP